MTYQLDHLESITPRGWICPKCDSVMAPAMMCCIYCKPKNSEFFSIPNPTTILTKIMRCIHGKIGCFECTTMNLSTEAE